MMPVADSLNVPAAHALGPHHFANQAQVPPVESRSGLAGDVKDLQRGLWSMPNFIPCRYLYNEQGNEEDANITKLDEYYLFRTEVEMLERHCNDIVDLITPGTRLVELGCGSANKSSILLRALLDRDGPHDVYFTGIDVLPDTVLDKAKSSLVDACPGLMPNHVTMISADYMAGLPEARRRHPGLPLCFLWLGSSIGNLAPDEAMDFFRFLQKTGGPGTQLFMCADLWKDPSTLRSAYCDKHGVTEAFIRNGFSNVLSCLPQPYTPNPVDWVYKVVVNPDLYQVEMYLEAERDITGILPGVRVFAGEGVLMEVSRKFTIDGIRALAFRSGFCLQAQWVARGYSMHMMLEPGEAMSRCHAATDKLFAGINDWEEKPIDLRHPFVFYYGHLAAFAAIKILVDGGCDTRTAADCKLDAVFERGIDPNALDPTKCHSHPAIPDVWPEKAEIYAYVDTARAAILHAIRSGTCTARMTHMAIEHDLMHHETLAYMLAQRQRSRFAASKTGNNKHGHANWALGMPGGKLPRLDGAQTGMHALAGDSTAGLRHNGLVYVAQPASAPVMAAERGSGSKSTVTAQEGFCPSPVGDVGDIIPQSRGGDCCPEAVTAAQHVSPVAAPPGSGGSPDGRGGCPYGRGGCPDGRRVLVPQLSGKASGRLCAANALPPTATAPSLASTRNNGIAGLIDEADAGSGFWKPDGGSVSFDGAHAEGGGTPELVGVPGGWVVLGVDTDPAASFVWDLEGPQQEPSFVDAFGAAAQPVTNAEFYKFAVDERGYERKELWEECDYNFFHERGQTLPATWSWQDGEVFVHSPTHSRPLREMGEQPVWVSLGEARAYCRARAARVMTEPEYQRLLDVDPDGQRVQQLRTGGWEWTDTLLEKFKGFKPMPDYEQYSADFYDGHHYVLRGSSPFTPTPLRRNSFRNFFQRQYPYVFAKFRCCRS